MATMSFDQFSSEHNAALQELITMVEESTASTYATASAVIHNNSPASDVFVDNTTSSTNTPVDFDIASFSDDDLDILAGFALDLPTEDAGLWITPVSAPASPKSPVIATPPFDAVFPTPTVAAPYAFPVVNPDAVVTAPVGLLPAFPITPIVRRVVSTPALTTPSDFDIGAYLNLESTPAAAEVDVNGNVFLATSPAFSTPVKGNFYSNWSNTSTMDPSLINGSAQATPSTPSPATGCAAATANRSHATPTPTHFNNNTVAGPSTPVRTNQPRKMPVTAPARPPMGQLPQSPRTPTKKRATKASKQPGDMFTFCNFTVADAAKINAGVAPSGGKGKGHKRSYSESAAQDAKRRREE
ncbi:uncharacterized protein EHS24_007861 [Apiotrichum porosum]|uniref:Uncharacterized protein n=1 Tax=Apiotrichum porosum TaxID=105984 RepID=A0A427XSA4_9TREE|nr:uncharacterized protein EHS24_007861 [Apiotrichum porosum]RSH81678.1 hypothetical protein EHS24_007861 [Apiotrichum porosum]